MWSCYECCGADTLDAAFTTLEQAPQTQRTNPEAGNLHSISSSTNQVDKKKCAGKDAVVQPADFCFCGHGDVEGP